MLGNQVFHCLAVLFGFRSAKTQLSASETEALMCLAKGSMSVVELGVFEGATTRRLLEAMPGGGILHAVDPFIAGRLGIGYGLLLTKAQVKKARRPDVKCLIVRSYSYCYVKEAPDKLDLVFIDADHAYASVRKDWTDWSPKIRVGGYIALHDSQVVPGRCPASAGPVRLVGELGQRPPGFRLVEIADSLTVYQSCP